MNTAIEVEVSVGELLDKVTILEIKSERISDTVKVNNVRRELALLNAASENILQSNGGIRTLLDQLKQVNLALWEIEDEIRECEARSDFGPQFIALARAVISNNDLRSRIKKEINIQSGSNLIEEKSYAGH